MGNKPSANGTRVYLSCEGVLDEVIARVEKAGGKIVMPRTKIGDAGQDRRRRLGCFDHR